MTPDNKLPTNLLLNPNLDSVLDKFKAAQKADKINEMRPKIPEKFI